MSEGWRAGKVGEKRVKQLLDLNLQTHLALGSVRHTADRFGELFFENLARAPSPGIITQMNRHDDRVETAFTTLTLLPPSRSRWVNSRPSARKRSCILMRTIAFELRKHYIGRTQGRRREARISSDG
jgi:hypothetical protein